MNLISVISHSLIQAAITDLTVLNGTKSSLLLLGSFSIPVFYFCGKRLSSFNRAGAPKQSTVVKDIAGWLHLFGFFSGVGSVVFLISPFLLAHFGLLINGQLDNLSVSQAYMKSFSLVWEVSDVQFRIISLGYSLGLMTAYYLNTFEIANFERGDGLHDVNNIIEQFKKLHGYDPVKYFNPAKGCFVGLELNKNPIYIPWNKLHTSHIHILGVSGCGKGILMAIIAYQCTTYGTVIWFDPKMDSFSPTLMAQAAKSAGKKFNLINLNDDQPSQFNLLANTTASEKEELLVAGLDLTGKGTDGDYHRTKDEVAAISTSLLSQAENPISIPELFRLASENEKITKQDNFWNKFRKIVTLPVINTIKGINLTEAINNQEVIYVIGSIDNERVKMLQRVLLIRIFQIIKKQDRTVLPPKYKCVLLDEFKFLLCPTSLNSLTAIRNFNTHLILSHQSYGDLNSCPNISREEAEGAVIDNTSIKFIYKVGDSAYAEKLSKNSGKVPLFVESIDKTLNHKNLVGGTWSERHTQVIDSDVLMHLPMSNDSTKQVSAGVIYGLGIAKIFHIDHIKAVGDPPKVKAAPKHIELNDVQVNEISAKDLI